tara:strand:+ start:238 stop:1263 length:1026 start_codon:yes stop_codon:yes gene_type:complete
MLGILNMYIDKKTRIKEIVNKKMVKQISIIIPCKEIDNNTRECIQHCLRLDYPNFEIILLPDKSSKKEEKIKGVRIFWTDPITPGAKRNIGTTHSHGEICAYIDSDAYPRSDWLRNAMKYFDDSKIAAVGGPGLTPQKDTDMQKASGFVLSSFMVGGLSNRYKIDKIVESEDIHSCNFIVVKDVLIESGGWNEKYWPGEDTLMCFSIKKLGKIMLEAPDVIVYHHRRPLFQKHLTQVLNFGLHRGFFAKYFRGNSLKITYFFPTILLFSIFTILILAFLITAFTNILLLTLVAYSIFGIISTLFQVREIKIIPLVWIGIISTHIVYGFAFLIGLLKNDLKR